jgi:hypothetical protein
MKGFLRGNTARIASENPAQFGDFPPSKPGSIWFGTAKVIFG